MTSLKRKTLATEEKNTSEGDKKFKLEPAKFMATSSEEKKSVVSEALPKWCWLCGQSVPATLQCSVCHHWYCNSCAGPCHNKDCKSGKDQTRAIICGSANCSEPCGYCVENGPKNDDDSFLNLCNSPRCSIQCDKPDCENVFGPACLPEDVKKNLCHECKDDLSEMEDEEDEETDTDDEAKDKPKEVTETEKKLNVASETKKEPDLHPCWKCKNTFEWKNLFGFSDLDWVRFCAKCFEEEKGDKPTFCSRCHEEKATLQCSACHKSFCSKHAGPCHNMDCKEGKDQGPAIVCKDDKCSDPCIECLEDMDMKSVGWLLCKSSKCQIKCENPNCPEKNVYGPNCLWKYAEDGKCRSCRDAEETDEDDC